MISSLRALIGKTQRVPDDSDSDSTGSDDATWGVLDSMTGTTLCQSCQSKLRCSPDRHTLPLYLVRQSSAHCLLCKMLIESFEMVDVFRLVTRRGSRNVRLLIEMVLRRLGTSDDRSDGSKARSGKDVSQINYFELQGVLIPIKGVPGEGPEMKNQYYGHPIILCTTKEHRAREPIWSGNKTLSADDSIDFICTHLQICATQHEECCTSYYPGLPSRVIEVPPLGKSGPLRLVVPGLRSARYATLSHCWGPGPPAILTTKQSLSDHLVEIPLQKLPRTFMHAVQVARALGLRYLWIDSLCIVQDDPKDWEAEAARMMSVYADSFINLSAAAGQDGHAGCLFQYPSAVYLGKSKHTTLLARFRASEEKFVIDGPLGQRGWVLQETILAPRSIHFAQDQLYWQCRRMSRSQDGVHDSSGAIMRTDITYGTRLHTILMTGGDVDKIWWEVVKEYSFQELTKSSDRFAALAGITMLYQQRTGKSPLAGLWSESIHTDLLWTVVDIHPSRQKTRNIPSAKAWESLVAPLYRLDRPLPLTGAPSWSWASTNSAVLGPLQAQNRGGYLQHLYKADITVLSLSWTGTPLTSQIKEAKLRVTGQMRMFVASYGKSWNPVVDDGITYTLSHSLDLGETSDGSESDLSTERIREELQRLVVGFCYFDIHPDTTSQVWCLLIAFSHTSGVADESSAEWRFDVLLVAPTEQENVWRRLGVGFLDRLPDNRAQSASSLSMDDGNRFGGEVVSIILV